MGFAADAEYGDQDKAIHTFVNDINSRGGIHGRKIVPDIVQYDPTNQAAMRALCKDWTEGSDPAFAVLDGLGTWEGDNQLCITQEGHTPFLGQWTTVSDWTQKGSPYLWWTGTDQSVLLATVVSWGHQAGLLTTAHRVGIIVGDRESDQLALNDTVLPALAKLGITNPVVQTIAASPDAATATMQAQAPLIVQQFRQAGVTSVIPLIPFNSFFPYLQAETNQAYFPHLLLSDYEASIEIALGLIPVPYEKALERPGGRHHPHPRRHRRRPARVPGRLRPRAALLLRHLEGAQRAAPAARQPVHRGAGSRRGLVPGDPSCSPRRPPTPGPP